MKKLIILLVTMLFLQMLLFSQNRVIEFTRSRGVDSSQFRVINLIMTMDNEILKGVDGAHFVIVDTISNKNDTIRVSYSPGFLRIEKNDFSRIVENDRVIFYFSLCDWNRWNESECQIYRINYRREWFVTSYSLLHIYTSNTREFRKIEGRRSALNYTYEFFSPEGHALLRAQTRRTPIVRRILGR